MSHFAKVENGIVTNIIVIEQEVLNSGLWGDPSLWIQTSYNTRGGIHYLPDSNTPSGQPHVRGNFAGLGHIYDKELDAFYEPSPYPSWTLNKTTFSWESPVPKPENYNRWDFDWNEETKTWIERSQIS
jgi:hypothetical protein